MLTTDISCVCAAWKACDARRRVRDAALVWDDEKQVHRRLGSKMVGRSSSKFVRAVIRAPAYNFGPLQVVSTDLEEIGGVFPSSRLP